MLYLSIYLSVYFIVAIGLTPPIGFPLSLAVLALFIPYFKFKGAVKIAVTVFLIEFFVFLPQLIIYINQSFLGIAELINIINLLKPAPRITYILPIDLFPIFKMNIPSTPLMESPAGLLLWVANNSLLMAFLFLPLGIAYILAWLKILQSMFTKLRVYKRLKL